MANSFKNAIKDNIGTTPVTVYTAPASTTSTVIGLYIANQITSQIYVDVTVTDTSTGVTAYLGKGIPVPVGSSVVVIGGDGKVVLETDDIVKVTSNVDNSADVIMSILEVTA